MNSRGLIQENHLDGTLPSHLFFSRKLPLLFPHLWGLFSISVLMRVTPVFKKGDKQAIENYCSITVLPIFGKLFEHMLCKQITTYYDHIMYSKMTAYRKQHSCETTLIGLVEEWRKALDNKEKAYILSMHDGHEQSLRLSRTSLTNCGQT